MVYGAFNNNPYGQNSNITAASRVSSPAPSGNISNFSSNTGSLNVSANSSSPNPFGMGAPDFEHADPNTLARLDISNLIYSPSVGGYITQAEQRQGHFGIQGGDPRANQRAADFYSYIGSLPTVNRTSPALAQLNAVNGVGPSYGPSYNSYLSNFFNTASPFMQDRARQAGFGPTYSGPYRTNY